MDDRLEDALAAQRALAAARRTPEERAAREAAIDAVAASGLANRALRVGMCVPSVELPDAVTGVLVSIQRLVSQGSVVLTFYRGSWCPYCNLALRALLQRLPDFRAAGASLVAVSPELPDRSEVMATREGLAFPVLHDSGNRVAHAFGIVHEIDSAVAAYQRRNGNDVARYNGTPVAEVPLPATYVIDRDGVIAYAFVDADYTRRAEPDDVLAAVRRCSQVLRHDRTSGS